MAFIVKETDKKSIQPLSNEITTASLGKGFKFTLQAITAIHSIIFYHHFLY